MILILLFLIFYIHMILSLAAVLKNKLGLSCKEPNSIIFFMDGLVISIVGQLILGLTMTIYYIILGVLIAILKAVLDNRKDEQSDEL